MALLRDLFRRKRPWAASVIDWRLAHDYPKQPNMWEFYSYIPSGINARSMYLYLIDTAIVNGMMALDRERAEGAYDVVCCIAQKIAQNHNILNG